MVEVKPAERKYIKRGDVAGKQVVEARGLILGSVKDLSFTMTEDRVELAVAVESGKTELQIPWTEIQAISDVVLLRVPRDKPTPPTITPTPAVAAATPTLPPVVIEKSCLECGYKNPPDAKYCVKCGKRLP